MAERLRDIDRSAGPLPTRGDFIVRGAYVVTMDPALGDMPSADVLVRNGDIVAVGEKLGTAGVSVIAGQGMVVLPGFVDTHWHLWNSFMRGLIGDGPGRDYFTVKRGLAPFYRPVDFYRAARLALAEAIESGITTVHNWDHNVRSPEDADANIFAQLDMGIRGRFSYGCPDNSAKNKLMDLADLERFRGCWIPRETDNRVTLGVALRGPFRTESDIYRREWDAARTAGLPITMHCDRCMREAGCRRCDLAAMKEMDLLGPDVQIVHAVHAAPPDIDAMAETGTHLSLSPQTELRTMGFPKLAEMLGAGVLVSLSIDTTATPCNADMFSQMRVALSTEMARVENAGLTPRRMLQLATLDGARDLGLADRIGSITPGKRADLILVRMTDLNMTPCGDPVDVLVLSGLPQNVDTVIADGRILKRGGRLVAMDTEQIQVETRDSVTRMLVAKGWEVPRWLHNGIGG
ncbi:MAG: amidohydrolase family protein [Bradyrhizobiaceae bacterium]|nr:amidohydrolase family protein [Bradyrhizobiaceae bacterium]